MTTELIHNLDHSSAGTRPRHQPIGLAGQRKSSGELGGQHGDILAQASKVMAFFS